jgi:hypothetical protein
VLRYTPERIDMTSNTLSKLKDIDSQNVMYSIHRCQAGWAFIFYEPNKDMRACRMTVVKQYYATFEEMVDAEWQKLIFESPIKPSIMLCENLNR